MAEGATHVGNSNIDRKAAFTLAEVLITLGIIGIVAAMVISPLIQKWRYHSYYVGLKKAYSTLSSVTAQLFAEYGEPRYSWGKKIGYPGGVDTATVKEIVDFYFTHMSVACDGRGPNKGVPGGKNRCNFPDSGSTKTKRLNGTVGIQNSQFYLYSADVYPLVTTDGMIFSFSTGSWQSAYANTYYGLSSKIKRVWGEPDIYFWIVVDVNGAKTPNQLGLDIFSFGLSNVGVFPFGNAPELITGEPDSVGAYEKCEDRSGWGWTCAGRVLREGGINY